MLKDRPMPLGGFQNGVRLDLHGRELPNPFLRNHESHGAVELHLSTSREATPETNPGRKSGEKSRHKPESL